MLFIDKYQLKMPEVIKRKKTTEPEQTTQPATQQATEEKPKKTTVSKTNRKGMDMIIGTIFTHLTTEENFTDKQIKTLLSKFVNFLPYTSEYRRKKSHKNPNEPKRALSPYFCFLDSKRKEVMEKNPTLKFKEINKLLGSMWAKLTDAEKQPYMELASKDRIRYQAQREAYLRDNPLPPKPEKKARKARAQPSEAPATEAPASEAQPATEKKARKKKAEGSETVNAKTAKPTIVVEKEITTKVKKSSKKASATQAEAGVVA